MSEITAIGRTNYFTVRKGTLQYRIAEGKRLTDPEFCWQLLKDAESAKTYFVNGKGVRRWHLPDIYQTEKERGEEEAELHRRKELRSELEAKKQGGSSEAGDTARDDDRRSQRSDQQEKERSDFQAREKAALQKRLLPPWERADDKKQVIRFVKSVLVPHHVQGRLDERAFVAIVNVAAYEFMATHAKLDEAEKGALRSEALNIASLRMDEMKKRDEYAQLNEELLERVKRLEGERRKVAQQLDAVQKSEDRMKEDLFKLRAQRQDVLLGSFKRLTRGGLVQAYWDRWVRFKEITEMQLHVRARKHRAVQMAERIKEQEEQQGRDKDAMRALQERVQKAEGKDVAATMLQRAGRQMILVFFNKWKRWADETQREKLLFEARRQLAECPNCQLQQVDLQRLRARFTHAVNCYNDAEGKHLVLEQQRDELRLRLDEASARCQALQQTNGDLSKSAAANSIGLVQANERNDELVDRCEFLQNEVDRIRFEMQDEQAVQKLVEMGQQSSSTAPVGAGWMVRQQQQQQHGASSASSVLGLSSFFNGEASTSAAKLEDIVRRRGATATQQQQLHGSSRHADAAFSGGAEQRQEGYVRGQVSQTIEAALAPNIHPAEHARQRHEEQMRAEMHRRVQYDKYGRLILQRPEGGGDPQLEAQKFAPRSESEADSLFYSSTVPDTDEDTASYTTEPASERVPSVPRARTSASPPRQEQPHERQRPEAVRCRSCGFRKLYSPFCPKDGMRHVFTDDERRATGMAQGQGSGVAAPLRDGTGQMQMSSTGMPVTSASQLQQKEAEEHTRQRGLASVAAEELGAALGLPPGRSKAADDLRAALNLDPGEYRGPPSTMVGGVAFDAPELRDVAHVRAVADYMRNTKILADRSLADVNNKSGGAGSIRRATRGQQEQHQHQTQPSSSSSASVLATFQEPYANSRRAQGAASATCWGTVFDTNDMSNGTLGITTQASDHVFGVYRADELRERRDYTGQYAQEQRGLPSMTFGGGNVAQKK